MRVIAQIVCWYCRTGNKQLFRIRDEHGFKTEDYICVDCKPLAPNKPPIGNVSRLRKPTKEEIDKILKDIAAQEAAKAQQPSNDVVVSAPTLVA